jgi:UDP-N-acetylmuramoyl-L-alanyl-D-glutamate--2,6-diaminopimelate ligase
VASEVGLSARGAEFIVAVGRGREVPGDWPAGSRVRVTTRLPGHFNVANALGAFAMAVALGVAPEVAASGLAAASPPPGRLEPVDEGQPFAVFVDYAHTPDSLENVLRATRPLTEGKLIVVVGAGGDRDRDKRPKMGRAAAEGADFVLLTSDNPRSEDPEVIIGQVKAGTGGGDEVRAVTDRRDAIAQALAYAAPGDAVVIAGKGHEQGQEFEDGRRIPFDDREVAREELRAL